MTSTARTGVCICGVAAIAHYDDRNTFLSCESLRQSTTATVPSLKQTLADALQASQPTKQQLDLSLLTYLTPRQAADYIGVPTVGALRSRMSRGTLPDWCYTRMGGSLRFIRRSIDEWAQGNVRSLERHSGKRTA